MLPNWVAVVIGGGLGALGRYMLAGLFNRPDGFPCGTLAVNLLGCFLIGALWQIFGQSSPQSKAFIFAGILGGFTTFSSFGLETLRLVQAGQISVACLYVFVSNIGGLALVGLGSFGARALVVQ